jgi:hypothetical protein
VGRVTESLGLGPGDAKEYEACIEGRVLELATRAERNGLEQEWRALRRGCYAGGEGFLEKLRRELAQALNDGD